MMRNVVPYLFVVVIVVSVVFGKFPQNTSEIIRSYGYVSVVLHKIIELVESCVIYENLITQFLEIYFLVYTVIFVSLVKNTGLKHPMDIFLAYNAFLTVSRILKQRKVLFSFNTDWQTVGQLKEKSVVSCWSIHTYWLFDDDIGWKNSAGACLNPPYESLPFILADAGYDVW